MMNFLHFLIIASMIGTVLWMIQNIFRPVTQKIFSQTWHYYTALIPVFFFLGGAGVTLKLIEIITSVLTTENASNIVFSENVIMGELSLLGLEQRWAGVKFINQIFIYLLQLENRKEILLSMMFIWGSGAIGLLAMDIKRYWEFKHYILGNSREYIALKFPVKIIISSKATTPMVMGILKPVVVLPDIPFSEKELSFILSHELMHVKKGDLLIKLIVLIAKAVHWFNPAGYILNRQLNTLCELSCDERVVIQMDAENRRYYGNTILSILDYSVREKNIVNIVCVSNLCNSKKNMKRRLINIMNAKKINKSIVALSLAAAIGLTGIGAYAVYAADSTIPKTVEADYENANYLLEGGSNITIESDNGNIISYDKNGNIVSTPSKRARGSYELTYEEIVERVKILEAEGIPVPEAYLDALNR